MSTSTTTPSGATTRSGGAWPVVLCWIAVALDGFDLVVLGAVIPTLSKSGDLGFTDSSLTLASTVGLVGVGLGAVAIGPLADRVGRRRSLIASITVVLGADPRGGLRRRTSPSSSRCGSWRGWGWARACPPRWPT